MQEELPGVCRMTKMANYAGGSAMNEETVHLQRMALNGRTEVDLIRIACRLSILTEEMETMTRQEIAKELDRYLQTESADVLERMLGYHHLKALRKLAPDLEKGKKRFILSDSKQNTNLRPALEELARMGLALRTGKETFHVDPMVLSLLGNVTEKLKAELRAGDKLIDRIGRGMRYWGAIPLGILTDIMQRHMKPDFTLEIMRERVFDIVQYRWGMEAFEIMDGDVMVFGPEELTNHDAVKSRMKKELYRKLPYCESRFILYEGGPDVLPPAWTSPEGIRILEFVEPSKIPLPDPGSLSDEERKELGYLKIENSTLSLQCVAAMRDAAECMRQGARNKAIAKFEAPMVLPADREERRQLRALLEDYLELCPQIPLRGWSAAEVRNFSWETDEGVMNIRKRTGTIPRFHDLCPCGSGKEFGVCHGRGN